jgi:hypothetical protein
MGIKVMSFRPGDIFLLDDQNPTGSVKQHNYVVLTVPDSTIKDACALCMSISQFSSWTDRGSLIPIICSNGKESFIDTTTPYYYKPKIIQLGMYHGSIGSDLAEKLRQVYLIRSGNEPNVENRLEHLMSQLKGEVTTEETSETETTETEAVPVVSVTRTQPQTEPKKRALSVKKLTYAQLKEFLNLYERRDYDTICKTFYVANRKAAYQYSYVVRTEIKRRAEYAFPSGIAMIPVPKWNDEQIESILWCDYLRTTPKISGVSDARRISLASEAKTEAKRRNIVE